MTEKEKRELFAFEKENQKLLDAFYISRGHTVDRSQACKKFDCIIDGKLIEEKIRDGIKNDILIEMIQDIITFAPGWYFETGCDYLHYVFIENKKIAKLYRINWQKFVDWYEGYLSKKIFGNYLISNKGWGITLNLILDISQIPQYLINVYNGDNSLED